MKPIEAGCLAIVVNHQQCPKNIGKVVKVLSKVEKDTPCVINLAGKQYEGILNYAGWLVSGDVDLSFELTKISTGFKSVFSGKGIFLAYLPVMEGDACFRPENLMRIDGGDEDRLKDEERNLTLDFPVSTLTN